MEKFPSFAILLRVIALVIQFINRLRRLDVDRERLASILLMKTMKQKPYPEELAFLPDPSCTNFPRLLGDIELYLVEEGFIWQGGRIGNPLHFNMGVKHTILLAKHHSIAKLLIMDVHTRCQHL